MHLQLVETENLTRDSADMTVNPEGAAFDIVYPAIVTAGVFLTVYRIFEGTING